LHRRFCKVENWAAIHGSDPIGLASQPALHDSGQFGAVSVAFSTFFHRLMKKSG
jgi:hypothetical protein